MFVLILNTDQHFVDQHFVQKFKEMHDELNHIYICLLNIIFNFTIQLVQQIYLNKLNVITYELFMKSIEDEINQKELFQPSKLNHLYHILVRALTLKLVIQMNHYFL
jgi:hypothetical protein